MAVLKRKDIKSYLTEDFWCYYGAWQAMNAGLGLPYGKKWARYPDLFVKALTVMELEYRSYLDAHKR